MLRAQLRTGSLRGRYIERQREGNRAYTQRSAERSGSREDKYQKFKEERLTENGERN